MKEQTPENWDWPRKGDRLFQGGADWKNNACLSFDGYSPDIVAEGYKRLADLGVEHIKTTRLYQDWFVFPIVFTYRQYIELRLKEIIRQGRELGMSCRYKFDHDLPQLWATARRVLREQYPNSPIEALDHTERLILEFNTIDPKATTFRYAENPTPDLLSVEHINLRNLAEVMDRIATLLDGVTDGMAMRLDLVREMRAEMASYAP
jgi:hypothetical protein